MTAKIFREILAENDLTVGPMKDFKYQAQFAKRNRNAYGRTTYTTINAYTNHRELAEAVIAQYKARAGKVAGIYVRVGYRRPGTKQFGTPSFARMKG